ncbi:5090_t:CDS:2, partial [Scutellospora calospora]
GRSMELFKFVLIYSDFVLDLFFLFTRSRDVPVLFLPSFLIILASIAVNFFITMFLFFKEFYGNDKFHYWAKQNVIATSVFIVLSYLDLESLDFASSDISNSSCVQAPFNEGVYEALYLYSKKSGSKWWQVGKASASKRVSSRKHPHFLSGFVPVQPGPAIRISSPQQSPGIISSTEEIHDEESGEFHGAGVG